MVSTADVERRDEEETNEPGAGDDEDTGAQVAPIVKLEKVVVPISFMGIKYCFLQPLLECSFPPLLPFCFQCCADSGHKYGFCRLHYKYLLWIPLVTLFVSTTKMREHGGNDKSCVWHATDFVDGELKEEMFAIRFRKTQFGCRGRWSCGHSPAKRDAVLVTKAVGKRRSATGC
ncbi:uncharacterized protein LOC109722098 [Ananas comosus]|uniref:Uncharacterized protein LOC109722098 n=1 Tax=Ananas comosus TaxID=4615 RepID=A0A6P5GAC3_ANACO|nr:uncharacterized protein LOC109722098 [Ananas comosus]